MPTVPKIVIAEKAGLLSRVQKTRVFFKKKPTQCFLGFGGGFIGFFGQTGKNM